MIFFGENPCKLIRKLENREIQFIILHTNQVISRPPEYFTDNQENFELKAELARVDWFYQEYKEFLDKNS